MRRNASRKPDSKIIREDWPRIRETEKNGRTLYEIDCRRPGTNGKQQYRASLADAEQLAKDNAALFKAEGTEGLSLGGELRAMAITADRILSPFSKTLVQAAEFYRAHLLAEQKKRESHLIAGLALDWFTEKEKKEQRGELSSRTLDGIRNAKNVLIKKWGLTRILALTTPMLEDHLDSLGVSSIRKENIRSLISQFLNWAIRKGYCTENIAKPIEITIRKTDGAIIFNAERATEILDLCVKKHPDLIVYCAVSLFAGLRPGEAEGLTWENIHLAERTIHILGSTSKPGETHNVHIEDNLFQWLCKYAKKSGPICPQGKTLERRRRKLHADLGYKAAGKNQDKPEWPQDVLRHSYASHWLAKYGNRAQLAENMCNSVDVIRDHYKKVVSKAEMEAFWAVLPEKGKKRQTKKYPIVDTLAA